MTYWDGTIDRYGEGEPWFRLVFHRKIPFVRLIRDPILALGEAYMDGTVELPERFEQVFALIDSNKDIFGRYRRVRAFVGNTSPSWLRSTSMRKQKADVQYHYDLGNDFYALWLDETLSYSCAYFASHEDSLTQAQTQKIEHVLKKLQLRPGEALLDIGSGWGWLIIRAAREYGVKAVGITLSEEQVRKTRERIAEYGLAGQVQVELMDYRELAASGRTFDKIASVGMFEHVGRAGYPAFMQAVRKLLRNGGLALLHTITHAKEAPANAWIRKYIFPGGYIPSLREVIWLLPDYDFHILDVENLRTHYAMTLDRWADGFEQHIDEVRAAYGDRFVRMWRLYLRSCAASFRIGGQSVHQILFSKGTNNDLPLTRHHLYLQEQPVPERHSPDRHTHRMKGPPVGDI